MNNFITNAEIINADHLFNYVSGPLLLLFGLFLSVADVGYPQEDGKEPRVVRSVGILSVVAGLIQLIR